MRTQELTLPGFRHDTFSSVYPAAAASPVFAGMPLVRFGLEWVHPQACSAHPLPDGRALALYRDLDRTAAELDAAQRGDGDAWRAFVEPLLDSFDKVHATMLSGFPPLAGPVKLLRSAGPTGLARFVALLPGSARGLGRRLFENPDARAWLYGAAGHGDVPPTGPGSAIAVASEPARARGRLAQPARRRTGPDRRAGRLPGRARRPCAHRCAGHRRGCRAGPGHRRAPCRRRAGRGRHGDRRRDAARAASSSPVSTWEACTGGCWVATRTGRRP